MIHDLPFVGFIGALFTLALRQPFLFVLAYMYIDLVAPQHLTYALLDPVPLSLISFVLAVLGWLIFDDKRHAVLGPRQALILALLVYCALTLQDADFPADAWRKWDWVWKALVFAMFLPLTLTSRLRIEAAAVVLVLSASVIIVPAGIKTLASGGGYGSLRLLLDTNTGLYESSILSCAAIATIPIALFLMRAGTIFPPDWRVRLFCGALCFACLLIPVGTEARTGLICLGALVFSLLRFVRHRMVWLSALSALTLAALPLLPQSFLNRMQTITEAKADQSASTRLAVWRWTLDYVALHPFGGGFEAYRGNSFRFEKAASSKWDPDAPRAAGVDEPQIIVEKARAYHSSYFEMLGEQGWPGLTLWLLIHITGLVRMERLFRRHRHEPLPQHRWIAGMALALQQAHLVYLTGALFVGIAFMPFALMLLALQIGLDGLAGRLAAARRRSAFAPMVPTMA